MKDRNAADRKLVPLSPRLEDATHRRGTGRRIVISRVLAARLLRDVESVVGRFNVIDV